MEYQIHTNTHIENHSSETSSNGINERVTYMTWGFLFSIPILICCDAATALSLAFFFCVVSSLLSILRYTIPYRWAEKERQTITKWHADTNTFPHAMLYRYSTSIRRYITYYYTNIYVWYYSYRKKQRRSRKKKRWWKRKKKRLWSQYTAAQKAHRVQVVASHLTNISNQM